MNLKTKNNNNNNFRGETMNLPKILILGGKTMNLPKNSKRNEKRRKGFFRRNPMTANEDKIKSK